MRLDLVEHGEGAYGTGRVEAADFVPDDWKQHLPTSPDHAKFGASYDDAFWVENKESLEERFKAWQAQ